ncbi:MAG TPA: N-acetylneuraminate synthase [Candidatus Omnitrophota bacterium]|nr:N-acetylneuraminate synthase [Candidatus Omnitrophota bacterium]
MAVTIIAEAGVNHNGDVAMALDLVDAAAAAGADAVKFQTFRAEAIISRNAAKADYQKRATDPGESQLDMVRRLELDEAAHRALIRRCADRRIAFLSTPFDPGSVELLARLGLDTLKIPSGEVTNPLLLLAAARSGRKVILSTGMCDLADVERALGVLAFGYLGGERPGRDAFARAFASPEGKAALAAKVTILHCTTEYPAPFADVNLRAMDTLRDAFGLPVGLSDHTPGISVALAAAARGAAIVEKHFTLDRTLPGPDHKASLEPAELAAMVTGIREVEAALGSGVKAPAPSERANMAIARKCLVALAPVKAGEVFTEANLGAKRADGDISPDCYWDWLGRPANRDYDADQAIRP